MLTIAKKFADEMVAHSLEEDPNECCGILSGSDDTVEKLYRITNTTKSPYRYLMDPQEFLNADIDTESNGWEFIAFYHSHTPLVGRPFDHRRSNGPAERLPRYLLRPRFSRE